MSWSHHRTNRLVPVIRSTSVHSSYMGQQATLSTMVACCLQMYTPMGWIPSASIVSTIEGYSHSPPALRFSIILVIYCAARWQNPYRTLSISPVTTQLSLPYKITDCATAFYIAPGARTVATVLSSTLATIPHRLQDLLRFW